MPNVLGFENVPLYSLKTLEVLQNSARTTARINQTFDDERKSFGKGDVINITRPGVPTVQDAPIPVGSIQDLVVDSVQLPLTFYKEIKFRVPDKDLAVAPRFIDIHVIPSAIAFANWVDTQVLSVAAEVPHFQDITIASATTNVLTTANKIMSENNVPDDGMRHYAATPGTWQKWLDATNIGQWTGRGQEGVETARTAGIGQTYSFMPYQANNLLDVAAPAAPTITTPTAITATKGTSTLTLAATTLTGTLRRGMVIQIGNLTAAAGGDYNRQQYAIVADATAAGNSVTVTISPPLRQDVTAAPWSRRAVRTDAAHKAELAFHRNAIALAFAPLPQPVADSVVAQVATDGVSGISMRTRLWYDAQLSSHFYSIDGLFGIKMLNPDMCVRGAAA